LNLISGDNGQGKTSVLEALYALATTKSFRTEKLVQVGAHADEQARVSATVREGDFGAERACSKVCGVARWSSRQEPKTLSS